MVNLVLVMFLTNIVKTSPNTDVAFDLNELMKLRLRPYTNDLHDALINKQGATF